MLTFLIARLSSSFPCTRRTHLGSFHHNASSRISTSFYSLLSLSESNQPSQKLDTNESLNTVSYLMKSLGFSAQVAVEVSKRVCLKDPVNPDSVLNLFRSCGFSNAQISEIVERSPRVLLANPMTILPKLKFFQSIGFSCSELSRLIICTRLLAWSLEKRVIPFYDLLKSELNDDNKVRIALRRSGFRHIKDVNNLLPNIEVLRQHGIPQSSVTLLLTTYPSLAFLKHTKFVEYVKFAKELGTVPSRPMFIHAICVSALIKKSTWESKLDIYERCGWSRDVTLSVFSKFPNCMLMSEKNITDTMRYMVDEMGLQYEDIAKKPYFLGFSLKRRIIPRYLVLKCLKMNGLINENIPSLSVFSISEKKFLAEFVIKFQELAPQLLNIYKGPITTTIT